MADVPLTEQDDMRLCPICRMPISVLATRCRHCGGEVARPRRKEASLTIRDLGGTEHSSYTPSGDVIEAIESFRAEVLSSQVMESSSAGGLPELDARSRDLMQFAMSGTHHPTPAPARAAAQQVDTRRLMIWAGGVVSVILALFLVYKIVEGLRADETVAPPVFHNRAVDIMADKGPSLDALRAALEAARMQATPDNLRILDEARDYVSSEVNALLSADPWEREMLERASRLSSEAVAVDNDARIRELRQQVLDEVAAYSMVLSVNADATTVTYKKSAQAVEAETVGEGDLMANRFEVLRITPRQIRLEDTKRASRGGGRVLIYWVERGELKSGSGV